MTALFDLWLPIVLSAVFVFVVSSVIHMALPIHKSDFKKLPGEPEILAGMRAQKVAPGSYMFPCASSMKEMSSPEMVQKLEQGPVGFMTVVPSGPVTMGKNLVLWFLFSIVVSVFAGYVATLAQGVGADGMAVFRITATVAFLGYAVTNVTDSIWKGVSWGITAKFVFDGFLYALATGATFAWLWPSG